MILMNRFDVTSDRDMPTSRHRLHWVTALVLGIASITALRPASAQDDPSRTLATEPQEGLKSMLALFGLDESAWRLFSDGQHFSTEEREPMSRLLHVLSRMDETQRMDWSRTIEDWQKVAMDPQGSRGQMFRVSGHVRGWERIALPPEAARRFGYDHFFLVQVDSLPGEQRLQIAVRDVPFQWLAIDGLADGLNPSRALPVRCDLVFVKTGEQLDGKVALMGATHRLAWFPSQPDTELPVTPSWAELAKYGMDVTLFNTLDPEHHLSAQDSECFYQLLWTVRRFALDSRRDSVVPAPLPIERILAQPADHVGQVYRAQAIARRAVRVMVEDPAIQKRLGLNHYYEVECSVALPDAILKLRDRATGVIRDYSSFPVTFCFPSLPKNFPEGDQIRQEVLVEGYFLKLWSYRSEFMEGDESSEGATTAKEGSLSNAALADDLAMEGEKVGLRQLSPLLVGRTLQIAEGIEAQPMAWPAWVLMTTVAVVVASFLFGTWLYRSNDQAFRSWRSRHGLANETIQPNPKRS